MASSGLEKWQKYFQNGCTTIAKIKTDLICLVSKIKLIEIDKGCLIQVLGGEYSPRPKVLVNGLEGRVKLADLEKPIHLSKSVKFDLKPDKLGISGLISMSCYPKLIISNINKHDEIPQNAKDYLISLVRLAESNSNKNEINAKNLFLTIKNDTNLINTINRDFMEILGPLLAKPSNQSYAYFPEAGNEPLYDFKIILNSIEQLYSSKKSSGSTNTLKASLIVNLIKCNLIKMKYSKEIELLELIKSSKVKDAPNRINEWLKLNYMDYECSDSAQSCEDIVRLEAKVVKYINESNLDFIPLVKFAVPDLWYVKAELDQNGLIKLKPLHKGAEITKIKLRGKSSPNHICDKLGFQL